MRRTGPPGLLLKRITPARFHDPPSGTATRANGWSAPPSIATRFIMASAKNPMDRPSGDQKGFEPRSVPASGRIADESSERSQRRDGPSPLATNTMLRPSGESASDEARVGRVLISSRNSPGSGTDRSARIPANVAIAATTTSADAQASRSPRADPIRAGRSLATPGRRASSISSRASRMSRHRSLESFRSARRSRRRAGSGVSAGNRCQSGSVFSTFASTSLVVEPSNARRPASIS
jgi:hypothetical protein